VSADLNGDGAPDLAIANSASNSISVVMGSGDGTFGARADFPTGSYPRSLAVGDLNSDGRLDLVSANQQSNSASVLLGRGDGTFGPAASFPTAGPYSSFGSTPVSVAIGDLDADGRLDFAVANSGSNTVSVFLGNGDGSFRPRVDFGSASNPCCVSAADMNGDGAADLVVANVNSSSVAVLLSAATHAYTVTAASGPGGSIIPTGSLTVARGGTATFAIFPDTHYHLVLLLVDGLAVGDASSYTFSNVTANHTIAASFAIDTHLLTISVIGSGTVARLPDLPRYDYGTTVRVTATPASGWAFAGWSGAISGTAPVDSVFMDRDQVVTAGFALPIVFDFKPDRLNLRSRDEWVTGYLSPQAPYTVQQIDVASIRLNGVVAVATDRPLRIEDHGATLRVQFLRSEVVLTVSPGNQVPITVTGAIAGQPFIGVDYISVTKGGFHAPITGQQAIAGGQLDVLWDPSPASPGRWRQMECPTRAGAHGWWRRDPPRRRGSRSPRYTSLTRRESFRPPNSP